MAVNGGAGSTGYNFLYTSTFFTSIPALLPHKGNPTPIALRVGIPRRHCVSLSEAFVMDPKADSDFNLDEEPVAPNLSSSLRAVEAAQERLMKKGSKCPIFLFFSVNASGHKDTQEIGMPQGLQMLHIFKGHPLGTSLLDDFGFYEQREKSLQATRRRRRAAMDVDFEFYDDSSVEKLETAVSEMNVTGKSRKPCNHMWVTSSSRGPSNHSQARN
ncbi:hypothetical protein OPV22_020173 [Ensete ventricosum]|uniref:YTH domain-containing family protein n=1 Tax=Ensete ventricosum TaxID=4639 RepID=A0AAV8PBV1_ENSVE|nr:hypothetical protein OPV22_020173 [Ensete ventricosum]